jgi:hypothetical protein
MPCDLRVEYFSTLLMSLRYALLKRVPIWAKISPVSARVGDDLMMLSTKTALRESASSSFASMDSILPSSTLHFRRKSEMRKMQ